MVSGGIDWNYREDILYQTYLGSASTENYTSAGLKYKIFDNNIGYIRYESFSSEWAMAIWMKFSSTWPPATD